MMARAPDGGGDAAFTPSLRSRSCTPSPPAAAPGEAVPRGWDAHLGGSRRYLFAQPRSYTAAPPLEMARAAGLSPSMPLTRAVSVTPPMPLTPRQPSPPRTYVRAVTPPVPRATPCVQTRSVLRPGSVHSPDLVGRQANVAAAPYFPRPIPIALVSTPGHRANREVHSVATRPAAGQGRGQELTMQSDVSEGNSASASESYTRPLMADLPLDATAVAELEATNGWHPDKAHAPVSSAPGEGTLPQDPPASAAMVASSQSSNMEAGGIPSPKALFRLAGQAPWSDRGGALSLQAEHKDERGYPRPRTHLAAPTLAIAATSSNSRTQGDSGSTGTGGSAASNDWQHQEMSDRLSEPVTATLEQLRTHFDETKQRAARQDAEAMSSGPHVDGEPENLWSHRACAAQESPGLLLNQDSSLMLSPDASPLWPPSGQSPYYGAPRAQDGGPAPDKGDGGSKHGDGSSSDEFNMDGAEVEVLCDEVFLRCESQIAIMNEMLEELLAHIEQH